MELKTEGFRGRASVVLENGGTWMRRTYDTLVGSDSWGPAAPELVRGPRFLGVMGMASAASGLVSECELESGQLTNFSTGRSALSPCSAGPALPVLLCQSCSASPALPVLLCAEGA